MITGPGGRRNKRRRDRVRLKEGSRIREPGSSDPEAVPFNDNVAPSSSEAENKPSKPSAMLGLSSAFNLVTKLSDKMSKKNQGKRCFEYVYFLFIYVSSKYIHCFFFSHTCLPEGRFEGN